MDVFHHVQDGLNAVLRPRGAVEEDAYVLLRVLVGEREELGACPNGDVLVDAIAEDDDAVEEERGLDSHRAVGGLDADGHDAVVELLRADRRHGGGVRAAWLGGGGARAGRAADADRGDRAGARAGDGARVGSHRDPFPLSTARRPKNLAGEIRRAATRASARAAAVRGVGFEARGSNGVFARTPGRACRRRLRRARDCAPPRALALAVTVRAARSVSCCLAGRLWVLKFLLSRSGFPRSIEWVN